MKRIFWAIVPAMGLAMGAASLAATSWKLSINGASVPTSARVIGGVTYVPIGDVARALGMKASVAGTIITLKPARSAAPARKAPTKPNISSPTTPVAGAVDASKGVVNQNLTAGQWGFKVVDVQRATTFRTQFRNNFSREATYDAKDGEEIVAVSCLLQNRGDDTANFAFPRGSYGMNTALIDSQGRSYQPVGYDVAAAQSEPLGKTAAPGGTIPFNLVFRVPQGARLKGLTYSVVLYGELSNNKSTDFSVNLAAP